MGFYLLSSSSIFGCTHIFMYTCKEGNVKGEGTALLLLYAFSLYVRVVVRIQHIAEEIYNGRGENVYKYFFRK